MRKRTAAKPRVSCICETCGKVFLVHACYIRRDGKRRFCSNICYDRRGKNNPRYVADDGWVSCKRCGKQFKTKPSWVRNGKAKKYCSSVCRVLHTGKKVHVCPECKLHFLAHVNKNKRTCCSRRCASIKKYRETNQMNVGKQRGLGGKRVDLGNKYFRSSWEANYARYLNFLITKREVLKWEYEPDTFEFKNIKRGTRFYTPDFKIYLNDGQNEYHEVKGWMDAKSKTRHKRMSLYFPNIKIKIIDKIWFRANGTILSKIIKNWEVSNRSGIRIY